MEAGLNILRDKGLKQFTKSFLKYLRTVTVSSSKFKLRGFFHEYSGNTNGVKVEDGKYLNSFIRGKIEDGSYEEAEFNLVNKHLDPDSSVVELGGGIGYIACFVNQKLSDPSKHVVLEANPKLIEVIEENRELNQADFRLESYAYHSTEDKVSFSLSDEFWKSSTKLDEKNKIEVSATNLEDTIDREEFDDFVLIADIEGGEIELQNELELLQKHCKQIIIEIHPERYDSKHAFDEKILSPLRENGFELVDEEDEVLVIEKN